MPCKKRKWAHCMDLTPFPDDKPVAEGKPSGGTAGTAASVSSAWLRCSDGFQTSRSSEKASRVKKSFTSILHSADEGISKSKNSSEFTDILWSSSGSDLSDDENKTLTSRLPCLKVAKYDLVSKDGCSDGEPQFIDWEQDSDYEDDEQCDGSKTDDTALDISDTDSCTNRSFIFDEEEGDKPVKTTSIEISEYSSDNENVEECQVETIVANLELPKKLPLSFGAGSELDTGRSATDWLKSAQAILQTPKKNIDKNLKSLDNSAKKQKLLRGGLAERLNRLQNRERAAISFWRHHCISDNQTPSGGKSRILMVKILEMHEECILCIAICHHLQQICADSSSVEEIQPIIKVLFAKETVARLKAAAQDIICIYPPWQKLLLPNENVPVILNTYFSQKVFLKEPKELSKPCFEEPLLTKRNISLAQIFSLSDTKESQPQASAVNQVSCPNMKALKATHIHSNSEPKLSPFAVTSLSDSLLDVVETQGRTGGRGIQMQVVVQRVYYLLAKEGFGCHWQENDPAQSTAPLLNSDLPNVRLCLLLQDAYGMFGEVQFQILSSSLESIEEYSKRWEGKYCNLSGIKVLHRVTRGRKPGLFSLIDSLWPPMLPLKVPGHSQENDTTAINLPPPSFCYILAAHPDHIEANERERVSDLYSPPTFCALKAILQMCDLNKCCSFWAYVIHRRLKVTGTVPSSQIQFWLFVTDFSLQGEAEVGLKTPRTLPVSVASSCVVGVEVLEALKNTSHCVVFFKDALCRNGRIICIERTILSLQKPPLCRAAGADITKLTGPVKLDELDSATPVNSICTVRGIVVGVNEGTAFYWPACNRCGNGKVEQHPQDRESLYCRQCSEAITSPALKMHLEVFLYSQSRPLCTVKVKLLQKTISLLLKTSPSKDGSYEVKSVLGKEVGFLYCYVQSVTSHPSSCVELEEIVLPSAERKEILPATQSTDFVV
ncbi:DNA repair-scaffolding protein isoform X2 [Heteronotia binoei]|uniref:DNA repair-scaffolding protein isoform X2 n=1 Tax=Heteronotia binoei TaxID=13085 RepID=UPI00292FD173|nr:DNA repair-scaffolding protein isoform X2 [Heteronotia binoei]